jgi:hypothetical protein
MEGADIRNLYRCLVDRLSGHTSPGGTGHDADTMT